MDSEEKKYKVLMNEMDLLSKAGCYPRELSAEDGEGFLFKGKTSSNVKNGTKYSNFQRKPPHLDMTREYQTAEKSYRAARTTITTFNERHRQVQIAQEETFTRELQSQKFTANFAETRLATCGAPTLNTMSVRIERQRAQISAERHDKLPVNKKLRELARREQLDTQIRSAVRRSYGSHELNLKSLELVHIPRSAVFTTLLLQFARSIRTVNVARNALRELPESFIGAFAEVETLICKENALARLPFRALGALQYLKVLNVSGNQLDAFPAELPATLEILDASRNRLQEIPNLHVLTRLLTLDLSYNHLQLVPCGLVALTKLQTLILTGNRLMTLALRPQMSRKKSPIDEFGAKPLQEEKHLWRVEEDPVTNEIVYFNLQLKSVTRIKPRCFQVHVPKLELSGNQTQLSKEDFYPDEWEIIVPNSSATSTVLLYVNHLTGESFATLPSALDRWDGVDHLHALFLSGNELRDLPSSIGKLKRLKRLEAENNNLLTLPDVLEGLKALETLKLGRNGLAILPPSFTKLGNITEVDVKLNRLRELPQALGDLQQLRVLDASANVLAKLPRSFLALKRLETLRLSGNFSLVVSGFALETLRTGNLAEIQWQLEHQIECEKHGKTHPPEPQTRLIGVGAECWSTNLHVNREFARSVELARKTHTLSLHWKGIQVLEIPPVFFSLSDLRELRLSGQQFGTLPAGFNTFSKLRLLQLRQNEIRSIAPEVFALHIDHSRSGIAASLESLDLRYNRLETLPHTFANCTKLQLLRASHNVIVTLPNSLTGLATCLTDLELAHNQLRNGPSALSCLRSLKRLDLSFNRLETLAEVDFSQLTRLEILRLSGNKLTELPMSLGGVGTSDNGQVPPIRELTIAGNMLCEFPPAVLHLGATLQRLEMQSNRFEQLPTSFGVALAQLKSVKSDGNPFRSPPAQIMRLGVQAIRVYLRKRDHRVEELAALLSALGLVFNRETFKKPILKHLLPLEVPLPTFPFLTLKHFTALDRAIDHYINGAFYLPRVQFRRGCDLLHDLLLTTHFQLAQQHHRTVLHELLALLALIREKRWADKTDLRYDKLRPWGRRTELVGVYMVRGSMLFPEAYKTDDKMVRFPLNPEKKLPSLFHVIRTRTHRGFPPEPFIENKRSLRDIERALDQYVGPYGPVGVFHTKIPMRCACEELLCFGKMHEPCEQIGWTMVRVLYSRKEVAQRELDEQKLREAQNALLPQIRTFLETPEGEQRFHKEVCLAKKALRIHLLAMKKQLKRHKDKLKLLAKRHARDEKVAQKVAQKRNPMKKAETLGELKARVAKRNKLEFAQICVREDTEELERGKKRLGQGHAAFREEVERVLLEKVGASVRQHLVRQQRDKAIRMGWRRPWDGIDGRAFAQYQREILRNKLGGVSEAGCEIAPQSVLNSAKETKKTDDDSENEGSDGNSEVSDVSFDGYMDLVSNLGRDLYEEDEENAAITQAARTVALTALEAEEAEREVDDLDEFSSEDEKEHESEDSDL